MRQFIRRLLCGHYSWEKTGRTKATYMICELYEHRCDNCGKRIYRDQCNPPISLSNVKLTLPPEEMTKYQETDVILSWNFPFMTLTESKMSKVWYHEHYDWLCAKTPRGFKPIEGSKKILFERGFERQQEDSSMKFEELPGSFHIIFMNRTLKLYNNPRYCGYADDEGWIAKCKEKDELIEWYKNLKMRPNVVNFINTYNR